MFTARGKRGPDFLWVQQVDTVKVVPNSSKRLQTRLFGLLQAKVYLVCVISCDFALLVERFFRFSANSLIILMIIYKIDRTH